MIAFVELVKDQFQYGGKKYANTNEKESTDILVDDYGFNWLLGTLNKYIYRYKNLGREKDLLKVACYCFIIWLKFGFHLNAKGTAHDNYTTVKTKTTFFPKFIFDMPKGIQWYTREDALDIAIITLKELRLRSNVTQQRLFYIYNLMQHVWKLDGFDKQEVHDSDTWLEDKDIRR